MMNFICAYPWVLPWLLAVTVFAAVYTGWLKKHVVYRYGLAQFLFQQQAVMRTPVRSILYTLRFISLIVLAILVARPQWLDIERSLNVKGIDIILALDVSGSMELFDDLKDRTPRIEAAKREALDFIVKRTNDPIGIVLFAAQALSKIPATLDKTILKSTINDLSLGDIDPNDTLLCTGLATAVNRLRDSTAISKVIVLLTDGVPSPNDPIDADTVIGLAKEFNIKIYTLGVGRADVAYTYDQFHRVAQVPSQIDSALLQKIAHSTGGQSYRVYTPADLKKAYESIDALEKTDIKTTLFHTYHELFHWFVWIMMFVVLLELFLRMVLWRGLV
jgi:Ca-activated chloride channel family protein